MKLILCLALGWVSWSQDSTLKPIPLPPPTVGAFAEQYIQPADVIAIGRVVSVRRLSARSVFVARFEVEEFLKEGRAGRETVLLLMAHTPEEFAVSASRRVIFAHAYRAGSRFLLAQGEFDEIDPTWKEKLAQLRFLIELEKPSEEPLQKRRQKLLERLLDQADRAPEWTRNNGLRELVFLAERSPDLFGTDEKARLDELIKTEPDRARRRVLESTRERLNRPRPTERQSNDPSGRRREKG